MPTPGLSPLATDARQVPLVTGTTDEHPAKIKASAKIVSFENMVRSAA